jgi:hypothetical protein
MPNGNQLITNQKVFFSLASSPSQLLDCASFLLSLLGGGRFLPTSLLGLKLGLLGLFQCFLLFTLGLSPS